jgi:uncharacterized protein YycO
MTITSQAEDGTFSGTGYTITNPSLPWTASGTVSGSTFSLLIVYTVPPPGVETYSGTFTGTILPDGKLSGSGVSSVNEMGNLVTTSGAATPIVPDISGTWSGPFNNVGVERYSTVFTITQNADQISGTASFVITESPYYPQDVGKSFTYNFGGTIDVDGNIHITGDIAEGPPEIIARAGHWEMNWQLSEDGKTISFSGSDQYGNVLDILLHRGTQNQPPVAAFKSYNLVESNAVEGPHMAGGKIIFVPEGSTGNIVKYDWNFGNKQKKTTTNPGDWAEMVYTDPEKYTVTLTVTDDKGAKATATEKLDLTLEPGDLILLRTGPPYSTLFNMIGATYTHVGMYAGKIDGTHYMIESAIGPNKKALIMKDGVQLTTFNRWSVNNKETYADAVRVNVDPKIKIKAVEWAKLHKGDKYDVLSIVPFNTKQLDENECIVFGKGELQKECKKHAKAYYCSELIWAAYYRASDGTIDLSNYFSGAFPPDGLYPNLRTSSISWHHEHNP